MTAIDKLNHHVIVCGFGRNGQQAAKTLGYHYQPYIVIENDEAVMERFSAEEPGLTYIIGDSTDDDVLKTRRDLSCKGPDNNSSRRCRQCFHCTFSADPLIPGFRSSAGHLKKILMPSS